MSNFEKIYERASRNWNKNRSPLLKKLLEEFYEQCIQKPVNLEKLKYSLMKLFEFLVSPEGRTEANLYITDLFVCINDNWEIDLTNLPLEFQDIIDDIGGALHDTIKAPEIAKMCNSTPEIILERAKKLNGKQEGEQQEVTY